MDDSVTVCSRCGSAACLQQGGDVCSEDGGQREGVKAGRAMEKLEAGMQCSCGARFRRVLGPGAYPMPCPTCGQPLVAVVDESGHAGTHCTSCHWPEVRP